MSLMANRLASGPARPHLPDLIRTALAVILRQVQDHGQGMVGHLVDAVVGHVAHRDALGRGRRQVHVVHADPVAHDRAALLHRADHRRIDRRKLGDDAVGVFYQRDELLRVFADLLAHDLMAQRPQNLRLHVQRVESVIGNCNFHSFDSLAIISFSNIPSLEAAAENWPAVRPPGHWRPGQHSGAGSATIARQAERRPGWDEWPTC